MPQVEVVFCLDTTGSMGGLIDGAKEKIWAICNQIASGKPTPDLKVGLVAYRDRSDAYVTKVFDLTDDLDAIHAELMKFQAARRRRHSRRRQPGAGRRRQQDQVGQGQEDAEDHLPRRRRTAAHGLHRRRQVPRTCKKAGEKDIVINTVQCGDDADCDDAWKDIAVKAEGTYVPSSRTAASSAVETPFDKDLA